MGRLVELRIRRRLMSLSEIKRSLQEEIPERWLTRIDDVKSCPDNSHIPRVPGAGVIEGCGITMHNGVRVAANSYYGPGVLKMLVENKGAHEPQEERAFEEVIKTLPEECVMLELGAYWSFYSLSLLNLRPRASCFMVEPDPHNIISGKVNFEMNKRNGRFFNAYVDEYPKQDPPTICVDAFCHEHAIKRLHILHSDIQGFEFAMLKGAKRMLTGHLVDYVFISTHSQELHESCSALLKEYGYKILASADMQETYSYDGLIVSRRSSLEDPIRIEISKRPVN
jgi:Methyltransferase FkbM domain